MRGMDLMTELLSENNEPTKELRTKNLKLRLTQQEYDTCALKASKSNLSLSDWVRQKIGNLEQTEILKREKPTVKIFIDPARADFNPQLKVELARIGNNINQISHAIHYANKAGEVVDLVLLLIELKSISGLLSEYLPIREFPSVSRSYEAVYSRRKKALEDYGYSEETHPELFAQLMNDWSSDAH